MHNLHNERGVSGAEMALILLLIVTVAFAAVGFFGNQVAERTDRIPDAFDGQVEFDDPGNSGGGGGTGGGPGGEIDCDVTPVPETCPPGELIPPTTN